VATLILARHGETTWNREGRFQGHADPPLSELGRCQAAELAVQLEAAPPDAIYASDLRRAHETATIVGAALGIPVAVDSDLREIDVGSWSGLTREEIQERYPEGWARLLAGELGHDGETREQLLERVHAAALRIAAEHHGRRVLVVSHGGSLRALRRHVTGQQQEVLENCATYELALVEGVLSTVD